MMQLVNIVLVFETHNKINLDRFPCNTRLHSGVTLKKFSSHFRIYNSGKIILTGIKSISEGLDLTYEMLNEYKCNTEIKKLRLVNSTYCGHLNLTCSWNDLLNSKIFFYEPELFPALYWRLDKAVVYLFHTGKYVITGSTSLVAAHALAYSFLFLMQPFSKAI